MGPVELTLPFPHRGRKMDKVPVTGPGTGKAPSVHEEMEGVPLDSL